MLDFSSKAIWDWRIHLQKFYITVSMSLKVIGLFRRSNSSWLSCGNLWILRNCSFLLSYQLHEYKIVYSILLLTFIITVGSVVISPISFLILVVCVFFLFYSLARILSIVLIFFKETAFCFIDFSVVFLFSVSLISTIFIISFFLLVLGMCVEGLNKSSTNLNCSSVWRSDKWFHRVSAS